MHVDTQAHKAYIDTASQIQPLGTGAFYRCHWVFAIILCVCVKMSVSVCVCVGVCVSVRVRGGERLAEQILSDVH